MSSTEPKTRHPALQAYMDALESQKKASAVYRSTPNSLTWEGVKSAIYATRAAAKAWKVALDYPKPAP